MGFVAGKGTTTEMSNYQFIDALPISGENLYRLRQVDINGAFSYSEIRSTFFESSLNIQVYPNPTSNIVNIRFENEAEDSGANYQFFDKAGRTLQSGDLRILEINQVDLSLLPEGSYILRIEQNGRVNKENIVKID